MFLLDRESGDLVRIEDVEELFDPFAPMVSGRDQAGEEEQDTAQYAKNQLAFPSGEDLPRCWRDANYAHERAGSR
jgi:hypothetical protein